VQTDEIADDLQAELASAPAASSIRTIATRLPATRKMQGRVFDVKPMNDLRIIKPGVIHLGSS